MEVMQTQETRAIWASKRSTTDGTEPVETADGARDSKDTPSDAGMVTDPESEPSGSTKHPGEASAEGTSPKT